uniref:hypothetical protein n=1 Tax=Methanobrevibacter smithii TaxID=2173 RepID=UPI0037DDD3CA
MVIKELNNAKKAYQRKDFKAADEIYSKIYDNHQKDFSRWDKNVPAAFVAFVWAAYAAVRDIINVRKGGALPED